VCWTRLRASSPALGSLTAASVRYCTTSFIGLTSRSGVLQADSDSSPVSERPRSTVPVGLLCPGRRCWHSATSAFQQPSPTSSTSLKPNSITLSDSNQLRTSQRNGIWLLPAQHLRLPSLFRCRPHSLELSPGFYRDPTMSADCFSHLLKTYRFARWSAFSALEVNSWRLLCYINRLTYLFNAPFQQFKWFHIWSINQSVNNF